MAHEQIWSTLNCIINKTHRFDWCSPLLQACERRERGWAQSNQRGGECGPRYRDHLLVWSQWTRHRWWGQKNAVSLIIDCQRWWVFNCANCSCRLTAFHKIITSRGRQHCEVQEICVFKSDNPKLTKWIDKDATQESLPLLVWQDHVNLNIKLPNKKDYILSVGKKLLSSQL